MRSSGEALREVKNGNIDSVYFLLGSDYYLQNLIINEISNLFESRKTEELMI